MSEKYVFSIIESAMHPDLSAVFRRQGLTEIRFNSMRKVMATLKKTVPDIVVAEFFYGYGNNYAGANISNLDVLLSSLQMLAPTARVIVLVDKSERAYVDKLQELFPLYAVLQYPVSREQVEALLG